MWDRVSVALAFIGVGSVGGGGGGRGGYSPPLLILGGGGGGGQAPSLFVPMLNINRLVNGFGEKQDHGEQKGLITYI